MSGVATLYVRNVPADVYAALRKRAADNGRSVNAEALEILERAAAEERDYEWIVDGLEEIAKRFKLPPGAPRPEELIRRFRDAG